MVQQAEKAKTAKRPRVKDVVEPAEELQRAHYLMVLIRHFEEKAFEMYTRAKIGGYCHLNIGEEAAVVGAVLPMRPDDWIISYYREHGHILARGTEPKRIMAELYGKATGVAGGRGGSMHLFDKERRFLGGYGIVGGQMPLAIGTGLSSKYRGTEEVTLCFSADGATNIGSFHETMNMIGLWKLPVIMYVINNQYGMGTSVQRASAITDLWRKAEAYDIPSERVDGMDFFAVKRSIETALDRARRGDGPTMIESNTYRYRGHSVADAGRSYRSADEIQAWRDRDPIGLFEKRLLDGGLMKEDDFHDNELAADRAVEEAVDFAESSPQPDVSTLYDHLYVE
ncbi:MAG TPA: pyruvate dehydrogenase (acetyl-transferring) E1 component subunit alpha [Chloroflexota bacterium]|jgi:pyruvate dehydrogenase E1 component alpha subunit|nr:pyruvate dehydrogenase (acetyl-transferring) E1 component subunit alpha [Chloroflexota bacterium]